MEILIPTNLIENFQFLRPLWLLGLVPENLELDQHHQAAIRDDNIAHYGVYTLRSR